VPRRVTSDFHVAVVPARQRQKDPHSEVLLSDPLGGAPNWEPLRPGSLKDAYWHPLAHVRECARQ